MLPAFFADGPLGDVAVGFLAVVLADRDLFGHVLDEMIGEPARDPTQRPNAGGFEHNAGSHLGDILPPPVVSVDTRWFVYHETPVAAMRFVRCTAGSDRSK